MKKLVRISTNMSDGTLAILWIKSRKQTRVDGEEKENLLDSLSAAAKEKLKKYKTTRAYVGKEILL